MIIYCRSETAAAIEAGIEYSDEHNAENAVNTEDADKDSKYRRTHRIQPQLCMNTADTLHLEFY